MLTFMFHIKVKPDCELEAISTLSAIEEAAHQDQGCINFIWLQNKNKSCHFTLFEQWESQEALDVHKSKGVAQWEQFTQCLDGEPVSEEFQEVAEIARTLSNEKIHGFVKTWFDQLSRHAPVEELLPMIADTGLKMKFPDKTILNQGDFCDWYREIGKTYSNQEHILEKVNIKNQFVSAKVNISVIWKAQKKSDGSSVVARASQSWKLIRLPLTNKLAILEYIVHSLTSI